MGGGEREKQGDRVIMPRNSDSVRLRIRGRLGWVFDLNNFLSDLAEQFRNQKLN